MLVGLGVIAIILSILVFCEQKHGPYYYAYWKDPKSKKLKKKYIGDHMPKKEE